MTNSLQAQATKEAQILAQQDVVINNLHLRGHTDARCKAKFDPKKHPLAKSFNTQVAEQTFSWFASFKHICRYMAKESYWIFVIGMFHERNKINLKRQSASRQKREQPQAGQVQ